MANRMPIVEPYPEDFPDLCGPLIYREEERDKRL